MSQKRTDMEQKKGNWGKTRTREAVAIILMVARWQFCMFEVRPTAAFFLFFSISFYS